MNNIITPDEIASIIKHRIDSYELDQDNFKPNKPQINIIGYDEYGPWGLEAAVAAAHSQVKQNIIMDSYAVMQHLLDERALFTIKNKYNFDHLLTFTKEENHPHGWYRKFEKKRF